MPDRFPDQAEQTSDDLGQGSGWVDFNCSGRGSKGSICDLETEPPRPNTAA